MNHTNYTSSMKLFAPEFSMFYNETNKTNKRDSTNRMFYPTVVRHICSSGVDLS